MTDTMTPPPHSREDVPATVGLLGLWLRRSWGIGTIIAIAAAAIVICTLAALPIALSQPRVYGAQTDLIFNPGAGLSDAAADRALVTQEVILRSHAVLEPVAAATSMPLPRLEKALSIEVVNQSNVLRITVADRDPDTARRLAQLIAEGYERHASSTTSAVDQRSVSYLEGQLKDLAASLADTQARADTLAAGRGTGTPISPEERQLRIVAATTQQRIRSVQDQLVQAPLKQLEQPQSEILVPAHVLEDPLKPQPIQAAAAGALVGVFVATAIVLVLFRPRFAADRDLWG
jgi:uncharacterized protein involved in exopolysaccharide biosynthesis